MITVREEECSKGKPPAERSIEELVQYGFFLLDKPAGPTSHEASAYCRKIVHAKKSGHSGTLDYDVSGVLPVMFNQACKVSRFLLLHDKEYVCVMKSGEKHSFQEVDGALENLRGEIYQKPPLASAVAKRLRTRTVHSLDLMEVDGEYSLFKARTQHGTYIRTICVHAGEIMGDGARMAELRRVAAGGFTEGDCRKLQDLSDAWWLYEERGDESELRKMIRPVEEALDLPKIFVSDGALKPVSTGANLAAPGVLAVDESVKKGGFVQVFSGQGELCCIAKAFFDGKEIGEKKRGIVADVERVIHGFE